MSDAPSPPRRRDRRRVISPPDGTDPDWPAELALVFVHGAMDRGAGMARLTRRLSGAETIRYDRRGYGHASEDAPVGIDGQVADLVRAVGDRAVVVFGHSFGGIVALTAAARRALDVRAVVTYEVPTPWMPWWPPWPAADGASNADVAEAFLRSMIGDDRWNRLPEATRAQRRAEGGALAMDVSVGADGRAPFRAAEIAVPTLLTFGTTSRAPYRRAAASLAAEIPRAELHQLDGLDHGAPLSGASAIAAVIRRAASQASVG